MSHEREAAKEILKGFKYMIENAIAKTTKIYDGIVVSEDAKGRWNIRCNGEVRSILASKKAHPQVNASVKIYVPQGNFSSAWFETLEEVKVINPYPVGAIYISVVETEPETLFGGKWERIKGKFLLGADETYVAGEMKGEAEVELKKENLPKFGGNVYFPTNGQQFAVVDSADGDFKVYRHGEQNDEWKPTTGYGQKLPDAGAGFSLKIGGSQPHNNMPPYLAVYMWKRIS